ncbi:SGNH/GDSL hydrolase family protein [Streptacidiphilus jiangxiensis]|uniref:GDSL-like Lipase/Acylhydrolase family protein n=1 Tax=Streptacidiphilus jiangxiensis TaxID=235985 RepID=A0A1H7XMA5_STRJI|nr:GDSL-type esterase/lipase family protein [Streptacidiphilus jiangxiensis]SEM34881.1 GDSL-like Lipase/Acylhydrolase family protein [Streptacidiphilus jiangxiensis]
MSHRATLTPQMLQYAEKFDDRGDIRWMPYLMYFHAADHRSEVVNTDRLGFRLTHGPDGATASPGGPLPEGPVRLLAGSSTAFGIGASSDRHTLPSWLWSKHAPSVPWLNFAGRSHNSTQELLLFTLYRHLLPQIDEIVLFSGFNNLGLSRLPAPIRGDSGAFFNCNDFYGQMEELRAGRRKASGGRGLFGGRRQAEPAPADTRVPELAEQIELAVELTLRHLDSWRLLAQGMGAKLTFVLQPLATWVRETPAPQERLLFDELDAISNFGEVYGDISSMAAREAYSKELRSGCEQMGVRFLDLNPVVADAIGQDDWLFVDRIHFTDDGHDLVAGLLARQLDLT